MMTPFASVFCGRRKSGSVCAALSASLAFVAKRLPAGYEQLPLLIETLDLYRVDDKLKIDELWSFVGRKDQKRWV